MLLPVLVLGGIGFIAAIGLGIAARVFYVKEDPRIKGVLDILPGANCGGCGYAGCAACAEAIVKGEVETNACVVGQTEVANEIAEFLGTAGEYRTPGSLPGMSGGNSSDDEI